MTTEAIPVGHTAREKLSRFPDKLLFATKTEIILSFYSNFSHFVYTAKLGLAPYLLHTCSVLAPYIRRLTFCYFRFPR